MIHFLLSLLPACVLHGKEVDEAVIMGMGWAGHATSITFYFWQTSTTIFSFSCTCYVTWCLHTDVVYWCGILGCSTPVHIVHTTPQIACTYSFPLISPLSRDAIECVHGKEMWQFKGARDTWLILTSPWFHPRSCPWGEPHEYPGDLPHAGLSTVPPVFPLFFALIDHDWSVKFV